MNELEYMLRKIIQIDDKASEVKKKTQEEVEEQETALRNEIKKLKEEILMKAKVDLEEKKKSEIEKAHQKAKMILKEADNLCTEYTEKYNEIKDSLKREIINELIETN